MTRSIDVVTVGSLFVELTPETPGEPMAAARHYRLVAGGAAANVVFALARLGARVRFITAVGNDEFGTLAVNELGAFGVATDAVRRVSGQLTPVSFAAVDLHGGKAFRFYRFPGASNPMEMLAREDFTGVTEGRLFDFSEGSIRDAGLRPLVWQAAREARAGGGQVLYAVNLRRDAWAEGDDAVRRIEREACALADMVVLNAEEVHFITGHHGEEGVRALQQLGPRVVILTRGGDGPLLLRVGDAAAAVPPFAVPVRYDVGAGDTFHAGLVAAALEHDLAAMTIDAWRAAARVGAAAAAWRVSTSADPHDLPTMPALRAWMAAQRS